MTAPNYPFVAHRDIQVGGVLGYATGDLIPGGVVDDLELEAAVDYVDNPRYDPQRQPGQVPATSALKSEWVAYAMEQGLSQEDAEALTKEQLIEQYGG